MSDLMSLAEAARMFDRAPSTLVDAVQRGRLPAVRIGRTYAVTVQDVADYIASASGLGRPPAIAARAKRRRVKR